MILAATHLTRLRSLVLEAKDTTDDDLARLASAPHLAGLEHLAIGSARKVGPAGIHALAGSPVARSLKTLVLYGDDASRDAIAASPELRAAREAYSARLHESFARWGAISEHEKIV